MDISAVITIVGSILAVLMAINAFFIKSLVFSINSLNLKMTTITIQHDHTVIDVKDLKSRVTLQEAELNRHRERLHSLEGSTNQVLNYIQQDNK